MKLVKEIICSKYNHITNTICFTSRADNLSLCYSHNRYNNYFGRIYNRKIIFYEDYIVFDLLGERIIVYYDQIYSWHMQNKTMKIRLKSKQFFTIKADNNMINNIKETVDDHIIRQMVKHRQVSSYLEGFERLHRNVTIRNI